MFDRQEENTASWRLAGLYRRLLAMLVLGAVIFVLYGFVAKTVTSALESGFRTRVQNWHDHQEILYIRWLAAGRPHMWQVDAHRWTMSAQGWPEVYSMDDCRALWEFYLAEPVSRFLTRTYWSSGQCRYTNPAASIIYNYNVNGIALYSYED